MKNENFEVRLIAKGSFIDDSMDGSLFLVETFTIHLNSAALNEWILSETFNSRECYDTDVEWEEHKAKYIARRDVWKKQIYKALKLISELGSISITQSLSEVFTVVYIREASAHYEALQG